MLIFWIYTRLYWLPRQTCLLSSIHAIEKRMPNIKWWQRAPIFSVSSFHQIRPRINIWSDVTWALSMQRDRKGPLIFETLLTILVMSSAENIMTYARLGRTFTLSSHSHSDIYILHTWRSSAWIQSIKTGFCPSLIWVWREIPERVSKGSSMIIERCSTAYNHDNFQHTSKKKGKLLPCCLDSRLTSHRVGWTRHVCWPFCRLGDSSGSFQGQKNTMQLNYYSRVSLCNLELWIILAKESPCRYWSSRSRISIRATDRCGTRRNEKRWRYSYVAMERKISEWLRSV